MTDDERRRQRAIDIAEKLFTQLLKLFLRDSLLVPELERMLRWLAIQVATRDPEFAAVRDDAYKQSYSRAAVLIGITRQEVALSVKQKTVPVTREGDSLHRVIRVLTAWRTEPGYQDENGHPIDLPLRGGTYSLHELCRKHGRDMPPRPIVDVIVESGNAEWIGESEGNKAGKMLRYVHAVVSARSDTPEDALILSQVGSDFVHSFQKTFNGNLNLKPRFREAYFNDIDATKVEEALSALHGKMQIFNAECVELLKGYRAKNGDDGIRLGVGSYSFWDAPLFLENQPEDSATDVLKQKGGVQ